MKDVEVIPKPSLTVEGFAYYKRLIDECPKNTHYFGQNKQFLEEFMELIKTNELPGGLYNVLNGKENEDFLNLIALSKNLSRKQIERIHEMYRNAEKRRVHRMTIDVFVHLIMNNEDYRLSPGLFLEIVFLIHKKHGPHRPFFLEFLTKVIDQYPATGDTLEKLLYVKTSPLYGDQVVSSDGKIGHALAHAWHRAYQQVAKVMQN